MFTTESYNSIALNRRQVMLGLATAMGSGISNRLSLSGLLAAESSPSSSTGFAKNCIVMLLEGGPSHVDLWDMKPSAPDNVRGIFKPIQTSNPGVLVCEHLPLLSKQMHLLTQVRSVHHKINDHNAGAYYALTGRQPLKSGRLITSPSPSDFPPMGSVLAQLRPAVKNVPSFVHIPELMFNNGSEIPGELAGFLGSEFDPLLAGDPSVKNYSIPGLRLHKNVGHGRLGQRRQLLEQLNGENFGEPSERMTKFREKARGLLTSNETNNAFDLSAEPDFIRQRYGLPDRDDRSVEARKFGGLPHLGQSLLLSRRLIEAGVRLVTCCTGCRIDQTWDTHRDHFPLLKKSILPYFDRAFSALLEDLEQRGLLEETLVVAMGEFGRTPKLGQITSGAGAEPSGRDHWPDCYTVLLAGGPFKRGMIYGASDQFGGYPQEHPVSPEDITATIYQALGIPPETRIYDQLNRPYTLVEGEAILEILR